MNLLYLVFGENRQNHAQAYFSICSFLSQTEDSDRIYMMTDAPDFYKKLGNKVQILPITQEQLSDWQGEFQFFWRAKIKAIEYVCGLHPDECVLYLDTDTFLFGDINQLKKALQNPVMHLKEGDLSALKSKTEKLMWQQTGNQSFGGITINHAMWNAGVVGIPANKGLSITQLALNICDDMLEKEVTRRLIEQFALSVALFETGKLSAVSKFIGHYWSNKEEWNAEIQKLMADSFLKNNSLEDDIQTVGKFNFKKIAIHKRVPNTQRRLRKLIKKWFPSEDKGFV